MSVQVDTAARPARRSSSFYRWMSLAFIVIAFGGFSRTISYRSQRISSLVRRFSMSTVFCFLPGRFSLGCRRYSSGEARVDLASRRRYCRSLAGDSDGIHRRDTRRSWPELRYFDRQCRQRTNDIDHTDQLDFDVLGLLCRSHRQPWSFRNPQALDGARDGDGYLTHRLPASLACSSPQGPGQRFPNFAR